MKVIIGGEYMQVSICEVSIWGVSTRGEYMGGEYRS